MFETQRDAERHRETQRDAAKHRETQRDAAESAGSSGRERQRETQQRETERARSAGREHGRSLLLAAVPLDALDLSALQPGEEGADQSVRTRTHTHTHTHKHTHARTHAHIHIAFAQQRCPVVTAPGERDSKVPQHSYGPFVCVVGWQVRKPSSPRRLQQAGRLLPSTS